MEDWDADLSPCNFTTTHFLQKEAVLAPCNFATAHLTACILNFFLPLTSRPMKQRTLSQRPKNRERKNREPTAEMVLPSAEVTRHSIVLRRPSQSQPGLINCRDSTNGAFVKRGVWPVTVMAWMSAALKLRATGISQVGLSRHPPPSQFLILPLGQTLTDSSGHLICPNQEQF